MVEMELVGVRVELPSNAPIVVLREVGGQHRTLPIFIGGPEATAIAFALEGVDTPRPMTHDLLKDVLATLGATLTRIVVTDLRESTFYAELHLQTAAGEHIVSSRPSDAVAIAARTGTTIFCSEDVLDEAAYPPDDDEPQEAEEVVEQFREFIDSVNPEDFAS
ncbi:MAG: bifunctional nuclease family protein [Acidimicrobiales bacterium]